MNNKIFLKYRTKVLVNTESKRNNQNAVLALMANIASLGFTLSAELKSRLANLTLIELKNYSLELIPILQEMVGAHVRYQPLFINFPEGVPEDTTEFYYKRLAGHFMSIFYGNDNNLLSCGHMISSDDELDMSNYGACPICNRSLNDDEVGVQKERPKFAELIDLKIIGLGTTSEFEDIFTNLIGSKSSISESNKVDCTWFIENYGEEIVSMIPKEIPHKEQLSFLCAGLLKNTRIAFDIIKKYIKTSTDVLRLAVAMSNGDVSLAAPTKFKSFKRAERRLLLELLNNIYEPVEDMLRHKSKWIRLGAPAPEATDHVRLKPRYELFIGGKFVPPRAGRYFTIWKAGLSVANLSGRPFGGPSSSLTSRASPFSSPS